ncbi:MAG: YIP1 family protein [Acidobacteria bacterium]|nr:YIP1 family protein [Acidobacteriota bacterium]MBS1866095.1 YIP1 family protein [Acidobacteriota bacterium]
MATTTVGMPDPASEPQQSISGFGRIVGVFFSPGKTFADIAKRPSWILAVIVSTVVTLGAFAVMNQKVDWREVSAKKIEESPRAANLSAEQKQQQAEMGAKITPYILYASGLLIPILFAVIVGAVMLGAFNLLGGANTNFTTALSIVAHANLVYVLSSILLVVILFLKPAGTIDVENPIATNLASFMADGTSKWLIALGKSVDIFTIWLLVLTGIGFAATNPRKLKTGSAIGIAFGVWLGFVVCRVGWAFIFS